jgi:multicomponent Na+:H+ antiporter subunit A
VSRFFAEQSYLAAHGRNVVNVILVDFRALDTLGEVIVIVVAAVGVYALLRARRNRQSGNAAAGEAEEPGSGTPTEEVSP